VIVAGTSRRINGCASLELRNNESDFSHMLKIAIVGGLTVLASLLFYQSVLYSYTVKTQNIELLEEIAYAVLALIVTGLCLSLVGITRYFIRTSAMKDSTNLRSTLVVLSLALKDKRSFHAFILSSLLYGVFFAFVAGFLVYQPLGRFSETYGVRIPSTLPVICCGPLGQMPQFVIYLSEQLAILIVPMNLILVVAVSWLVGLNVAIARYSYKNRSSNARSKWFGGLGAFLGIFTACPTCAGYFFLTMLGLAGAVTFALTLSSLQILFLTLGLLMLLLTPITTARRIQSGWATSCSLPGNKEPVSQRS
jgi:hypothetical protein